MKKIIALLTTLAMITAFTSCGEDSQAETPAENPAETVQETPEESGQEETTESEDSVESETAESEENSDKVASADEMVIPDEVGYEGMKEISGDSLKDGEYDISVDSSSSMFKIINCKLNVNGGEMTASMTMSGTGYLYLFMGTAEDAAESSDGDRISFEENENGEYVFTVPVEALDKVIDCAAYSRKKEQWYARQLVFRADSLPLDAFAEGSVNTVESLGLEDGIYAIEVNLEGGSGKATVNSPAKLTVENGQATAEIIWSSNSYDYMIVDGEKYLPVSAEEFSVFEIPVIGFDYKMPVSADTTAMSTPHEIEYTLYFDSVKTAPWIWEE